MEMKKFLVILLILVGIVSFFKTVFAQEAGPLVCLDPGHGGNTGAYNEKYNLWEDEINLDVAFRLKDILESNGYSVGMTRTDNSEKSNNDRYSYCNNIGADVLVSIHTNSSTNTDIDGSMGLYFHKDDKVLTQAIYEMMYPALRDDSDVNWVFTDFGLDRYASGVLLKSDMPAAMMETVMMSHDPEAYLLNTSIYQQDGSLNPDCDNFNCRRAKIAQSIFDGIKNYFANYAGNSKDGTGGGKGGSPGCGSPPCKK